jgi:hypothetical protein
LHAKLGDIFKLIFSLKLMKMQKENSMISMKDFFEKKPKKSSFGRENK